MLDEQPQTPIKKTLQPINGQTSGLNAPPRRPRNRILIRVLAILLVAVVGSAAGGLLWYNSQLASKGSDKNQLERVTIVTGSTPSEIGALLQDKGVIRSAKVFDIYTKISGHRGDLQAGTYRLSPGETIPEIVKHLVNGNVDQFTITFFPGATLTDTTDKDASKKLDVTTVLTRAGYTDQEIASALKKTYDSPLFNSKPTGTDLEGYVYGDTYRFSSGATVEDILTRTFSEFAAVVQDNNLVAKFKEHGLSLYQGITLSSIVQREVNTPQNTNEPSSDQKQVAQVFYSRLTAGMTLGSDVTYQYAADKLGVARDVNLDSPYNTRRFVGLPPGPISSPGLTALKAVASPASGDYLFFLSGDDGITYFARTSTEHDANVANHCQVKCSQP